MVSHIDDDHINGIQKLTNSLVAATVAKPAAVKFQRFWFNSFDKLVGPKPQGLSPEAETASGPVAGQHPKPARRERRARSGGYGERRPG